MCPAEPAAPAVPIPGRVRVRGLSCRLSVRHNRPFPGSLRPRPYPERSVRPWAPSCPGGAPAGSVSHPGGISRAARLNCGLIPHPPLQPPTSPECVFVLPLLNEESSGRAMDRPRAPSPRIFIPPAGFGAPAASIHQSAGLGWVQAPSLCSQPGRLVWTLTGISHCTQRGWPRKAK